MRDRDEALEGAMRTGQLAAIVECERDLADRLADARAEAAQMVEDARTAAQRAEAELEASLAREALDVRARLRQQTEQRVRDTLAAARARASRFDDVTEAEVDRLAGAAFRFLVSEGGGE